LELARTLASVEFGIAHWLHYHWCLT